MTINPITGCNRFYFTYILPSMSKTLACNYKYLKKTYFFLIHNITRE